MTTKIGSIDIADVKLGSVQVNKIYLGGEQVWGGSPTPSDPLYGEVVLYGYTQTVTNISNITGGRTITITNDDDFYYMFSGMQMGTTYVLPITVNVTGSDSTDFYSWEYTGHDANNTPLDILGFDDPGFTISGTGSFSVGFTITSFAGVTIDKTTTNTTTLASVNEFNQLAVASGSKVVLNNVPKEAVKSVKVGTNITSTPARFLYNCPNLTSVEFSTNSSLTSIGDNFLSSISSSTTSIDQINLPNGVTTIGNSFLYACGAYNQPIVLPNSVTSIGNDFLRNNSAFNSQITMPTSLSSIGNFFLSSATSFNSNITNFSSCTTIGNSFLSGCSKFNKDITLPNTLTSVGSSFMLSCNAMTSTVNIGTLNPTVFDNSSNYTLATISSSAAIYTTGVYISGTNRAAFMTRFPNRTSSPYRKLKDGGA